jgi:hypothetical protein
VALLVLAFSSLRREVRRSVERPVADDDDDDDDDESICVARNEDAVCLLLTGVIPALSNRELTVLLMLRLMSRGRLVTRGL